MKNSAVAISVALMLLMIASLPGLSFGLSSSITSENNDFIIGEQELIEVPSDFGIAEDPPGSGTWLIHDHYGNNIITHDEEEVSFTVNGSNYYLKLTLSKTVFTNPSFKFQIGYGPDNENILLNSENGSDSGNEYIFYLYRESEYSSKIIAHKEPPGGNNLRIDDSTTFKVIAKNKISQARLEVRVVFN